jgi:hypothetical protein
MTRQGRYPQELRERAVRLMFEHQGEYASQHPWVACGLFDGLAHEPRRHGVQPVGVVLPGRSGGSRATTDPIDGYQAAKRDLVTGQPSRRLETKKAGGSARTPESGWSGSSIPPKRPGPLPVFEPVDRRTGPRRRRPMLDPSAT